MDVLFRPARTAGRFLVVDALASWTRTEHTADVAGRPTTHPVWRKGTGPGVVVVHEIPGITPEVVAFAEEVVAAGHTVLMPSLFGTDGAPMTAASTAEGARPGVREQGVHQAAHRRDDPRRGMAALAGARPARRGRRARRRCARDVLHRRFRARHDGRPLGHRAGALPAERALRRDARSGARPQPVARRPRHREGPLRRRPAGPRPALPLRPSRRQALRHAHHRARRGLHPRGVRGQGPLDRHRPPRSRPGSTRCSTSSGRSWARAEGVLRRASSPVVQQPSALRHRWSSSRASSPSVVE